MNREGEYAIDLDVRHGPLEVIDVRAMAEAVVDPWHNQTLTRINDSVVRLGVVHGQFHWHHHDEEDEFFFVVSGRFVIELSTCW